MNDKNDIEIRPDNIFDQQQIKDYLDLQEEKASNSVPEQGIDNNAKNSSCLSSHDEFEILAG